MSTVRRGNRGLGRGLGNLIPGSSEEEKAKSPGEGKSTGQKVSHFISPGGAFDRACRKLLESGFQLNLHQLPILSVPQKKRIGS